SHRISCLAGGFHGNAKIRTPLVQSRGFEPDRRHRRRRLERARRRERLQPLLSSGPARSFVARKVFQLAQAQWNATQIKELLLRAVHNEMSILRRRDTRDPYKNLGGRAVQSSSSGLISIFP